MIVRKTKKHHKKLDFTISLMDMMSGLLFVFIIALVYFIVESQNIKIDYSNNMDLKKQILISLQTKIEKELRKVFEKDNIYVEYFEDYGVLRLPDQYFFRSGEYELFGSGKKVLQSLKSHIYETLNCETTKIEDLCVGDKLKVQSFFIEGHTDCDPVSNVLKKRRRKPVYSNVHLSTMRAISAFNELTDGSKLMDLKNLNNEMIFTVSGHGLFRPANITKRCAVSSSDKAKDRRIEFKIVMHLPKRLQGY